MIAKQENPLTFRLYQSIRFDRPIDKDKHYISPGGYDIRMKAENGEEMDIQFDLCDYEGCIDDDDASILNVTQKNPDYESFPDIAYITEYMLRHIVSVNEWFIYTGEDDEEEIIPVEIFDAAFEIITRDGDFVQIEIPKDISIKPSYSGMPSDPDTESSD